MPRLSFVPPQALDNSRYFGGQHVSLDRLKSLLMLSGHGVIDDGQSQFKLTTDFMGVPSQKSTSFKVKQLLDKIPGCTAPQLHRLVSNAAAKNIRVHQNVYRELLSCLYYYETRSYIASFVHLYRLIEHSALYLPLVAVISGSNDLTFNDYKQVIDNKAKADLSVLRKFPFKRLNPTVAASTAKFSFAATANSAMNCTVARSVLDDKFVRDFGPDWLEMEYTSIDSLIVGFRNEFFHYLYHEKNISLGQMPDPDEFLAVCMPFFISYFSFLYREFFIAEWELWA